MTLEKNGDAMTTDDEVVIRAYLLNGWKEAPKPETEPEKAKTKKATSKSK